MAGLERTTKPIHFHPTSWAGLRCPGPRPSPWAPPGMKQRHKGVSRGQMHVFSFQSIAAHQAILQGPSHPTPQLYLPPPPPNPSYREGVDEDPKEEQQNKEHDGQDEQPLVPAPQDVLQGLVRGGEPQEGGLWAPVDKAGVTSDFHGAFSLPGCPIP